jgi:hypothetical protein
LADEAKRMFEREFGGQAEEPAAPREHAAQAAKPLSIEKYVGADSRVAAGAADAAGAAATINDIAAMPFKTFTKLNNYTSTPVTRERYHVRDAVSLSTLREAKRQAGTTLSASGWDKHKKKIQKRCEAAGRIMSFKTFFKDNHAYITMNKDSVSKTDLWKRYVLQRAAHVSAR